MEIRQEKREDVVIIQLLGRLDEIAISEVDGFFSNLLTQGVSRLLLDLSQVEYISSSGLRVLLMLSKALKEPEGALKLAGLSPFVAEVFEISNFGRIFDIYPTTAAATAAFAQSR